MYLYIIGSMQNSFFIQKMKGILASIQMKITQKILNPNI